MAWFDGWFASETAHVPDSIGKAKGAKLRKGAERQQAKDGGMFSRKAVDRRHASQEQRSLWRWS